MKLFFHWFRWDLRRLHIPLKFWVLGVIAFFVFSGYLNHDLQSTDQALLRWTPPCAVFLLMCETLILLQLFSSDSALGTEAFWKTRPPAGWAVALSKVVIALVFFLGLPLLGWWLVLIATGNEVEMLSNGESIDRVTWMQRLWWTQALLIAACLIAGSVSRAGRSIGWRVVSVAAIFLASAAVRGWWEKRELFPATSWQSQPPLLWLVVGLAIFFVARLRRTPSDMVGWLTLAVPALLAVASVAMPFLPSAPPSYAKERTLDPEFASLLHVGDPLLMTGFSEGMLINSDSEFGLRGFPITLHLEGLPVDCRATGFWQEISITTPEGRRVSSVNIAERKSVDKVERPLGYHGTNRAVRTAGAVFLKRDLTDLGLARCRLAGTLRLRVEKRREQSWPLMLGKVMPGPAGHIRIDSVSSDIPSGYDNGKNLISGAILNAEPVEEAWWWLQHREHDIVVPFWMRHDKPVTGWFVEPKLTSIQKSGSSGGFEPLPILRLRRAAAQGKLSEWDFHAGWYETLGYVDVPISAREFVVPNSGSEDGTAERITKLFPRLTSDAVPEEVRSAVKYGIHFHELTLGLNSGRELLPDLLATIPPRHRGVLQEILRNEFRFTSVSQRCSLAQDLLVARIVQMLAEADIEEIRKDKFLYGMLEPYLVKMKLITPAEKVPSGLDRMADATLRAVWLSGAALAGEGLAEAAKRGQAWVPEALGELASYPSNSINHLLAPVLQELAKNSDFPKEDSTRTDRRWLLHNGTNIRWDANTKRWVLP